MHEVHLRWYINSYFPSLILVSKTLRRLLIIGYQVVSCDNNINLTQVSGIFSGYLIGNFLDTPINLFQALSLSNKPFSVDDTTDFAEVKYMASAVKADNAEIPVPHKNDWIHKPNSLLVVTF